MSTLSSLSWLFTYQKSAFKVAWSAVKRDYEKGEDGQWHKSQITNV
ncbi:ChaB family protein [Anabaena sp. FACHB-83]